MSPVSPDAAPAPVSRATAFLYWLKLGFISFGGPAGQISLMHQELVERRRWISEHRFLHALNYCMMLPGPEAQQLATYIGWLMHGTWGGIVAGVLFVLPSLVILIVLSWIYLAFSDVPVVAAALYGIKPAVVAIVVFAAYRIGSRTLRHPALWAISIAAFLAVFAIGLPFPYVVAGAALAGLIGGWRLPQAFRPSGAHTQGAQADYGPALIDDDTPLPERARFRWWRVFAFGAGGLAIWAGALYAVTATAPPGSPLADMAWFFTKAAFVTFGGAYAVLDYLRQAAVETHGWLTAAQMMDGLALGETTPGPLIMIVAFVGFLGGWGSEFLGSERLAWAGSLGAIVATVFTFLPSFLFILLGGPAVEASRHDLRFAAPLTAITAAVVGVILNLAAVFAWHVLWPDAGPTAPFGGGFDLFALLLAAGALLALWRLRLGVVTVLAACALLGGTFRLIVG
jgi:chromate transporter